jgi:carboxypeptidase PM20D1
MNSRLTRFAAALVALAPAPALSQTHPAAEAQTLDLAKETIALRSVQGDGNRTAEVAQAFRRALLAGGWAERDIEIVPVDDTAYFVATWPGSDPALGPVVISAHMDVVEARPEDWERDPFTPVVENGYLYGRGASDTKFEASLAVASLIELRRQGFRPRRSIVVAYSGDEETTMKTSKLIAERLRNAHIVLNVDGASGLADEETGAPLYWTWQGAEKTYIDFQLEVTNPGGHSSAPRPDNAIAQLAQALGRIAAHRFAPELNAITKAYFEQVSAIQPDPELAAAMRAFAADPTDARAIETLRGDTIMNAVIGTTCVPTMVQAGHAPNALPQRATAIVNCRVFPGHANAEIQAELERVAATPEVTFTDVTGDTSTASPPSPLRPEFVAAFEKGVRAAWGDVPIYPAQSSGASDSMWYRALGVPSYGASASFIKESDEFSHGLNERVPLNNIRPGITYYLTVLRELASM